MIDTMDKHSCELFLEDALEIGRRLVETGAEVKRVEDTVRRICIAYGFTDCEIYAVTSLSVASIRDKDGNHYTQSVRVQSYGTDLGRLEELNAFSRRICAQVPDVEDLTRQIRQYKKGKPKPVIKCLGYMLAAGGFSVFYGGDLKDGLAAAAIAIVIYLMDYHLKLRQIHNVIYTFVAGFVSGLLALGLAFGATAAAAAGPDSYCPDCPPEVDGSIFPGGSCPNCDRPKSNKAVRIVDGTQVKNCPSCPMPAFKTRNYPLAQPR